MKMQKRILLPALALLLLLSACGGGGGYDPEKTSAALLESDAFSEVLEAMDLDIACAVYGIDSAAVTAGAAYASLNLSAESIAIFTFTDEAAARAAVATLEDYTEEMKAAYGSYLPTELPKLDATILEQSGKTVLYVVAADAAAARSAMGGK